MLKVYIETINVNFKLTVRCENWFLMILDFIFEHIPILIHLPDFSSCCIFGTCPGFETITGFQLMSRFRNIFCTGYEKNTGIHINVNFQAFTHFRNKTRCFDKVKYKQNRK